MHRKLILALVMACIGGCEARPAAGVPDGGAGLGPFRPLLAFYQALDALQAGRSDRVAVLQLGDSHTANDSFSGRMRELMQARFGDAGRGMMPAAIPYRYYRPAQVTATAEGWSTARSGGNNPAPGPFGLTGLRQHADGPATATLATDTPGLSRITIEALAQPGGGTIEVQTGDGTLLRRSTAGPAGTPLRFAVPGNEGTSLVSVGTVGDGPVDWLSWTAERKGPGLTWSNLGTIGAEVPIVARWDPALASEAAALKPALVIVAFGTNEGFRDITDMAAYPAQFRAALSIVRRMAPQAALLVLGPPGGARAARSGPGTPCAQAPGFAVPANLAPIRAIQRREAAAAGAYFWDWSAAMGGDCAIVAWAATQPPLAARDYVHLFQPGYRITAEALAGELMQGYDRYRQSVHRP